MPAPAVIHCVSPSPMMPPPPLESWCSTTPSITYVTVSKPRWGCDGAPFASLGASSTGPSWSSRKNGSAMWVSIPPGNGRHTSKPAPSMARRAEMTLFTGRDCASSAGRSRRGSTSGFSTVTAGMPRSTRLRRQLFHGGVPSLADSRPMAVRSGDLAPDFTLPGTGGRDYTLSEFRGEPVVLVFYPGDATPVCTEQLNQYTGDIDQFTEVGARVLAISPQSVKSHERFSCSQGGFAFPLLADEDKAVGEAYGIIGPVGFYRRSCFVVDKDGIIRYAHRAVGGMRFRPTAELVDAVRA